jgi:anthranilate 1,2-dioxygenase large subunit/terephthalate 1,2-dioxygenase oxygenase component alpha subunit
VPWEPGLHSRVPYGLFQREDVFASEQERIFEGAVWNFLGLEAELPGAGSFKTTWMGRMPVVVARGADGTIHAFENRCAHRGTLIRIEDFGCAPSHACVYHAWRYDAGGNLLSIAFERGVKGLGGMPAGFCREEHGPRKLRVETFCGLVFGSLSPDAPSIEDYLGSEIASRVRRVLGRPLQVLGRFTQALPNNWKLYAENVRDTYHASLLHTFFTTFGITRLTQEGGVFVSDDGAHHASASYSRVMEGAEQAYSQQGLRTQNAQFGLGDASMLRTVDEIGDGIVLQILSVFPGFVLQQIHNCLAVRQIVPTGVRTTDLHWTYIGYAGDTEEMQRLRLKQANLVGPAGYVSMEDGAVGGFIQRGIEAAGEMSSVIELGGTETKTQPFRATESSVRGFWRAYRAHMAI